MTFFLHERSWVLVYLPLIGHRTGFPSSLGFDRAVRVDEDVEEPPIVLILQRSRPDVPGAREAVVGSHSSPAVKEVRIGSDAERTIVRHLVQHGLQIESVLTGQLRECHRRCDEER